MRQTLIQITGQESNKRRMNPGIGIKPTDHLHAITMANRNDDRRYRRLAGSANRFDAGTPQAAHGFVFLARAIVLLAKDVDCGPSSRRQIPTKTRQHRRFFQKPRKLSSLRLGDAMQHHSSP